MLSADVWVKTVKNMFLCFFICTLMFLTSVVAIVFALHDLADTL